MILNYFIPSSDSYICKAILKFRKKIVTFSSFFSKNCWWCKFLSQEQCSGHQSLTSCYFLYYKLPVFKRVPHSLHLINFLLWCGRSKYYSILIKKRNSNFKLYFDLTKFDSIYKMLSVLRTTLVPPKLSSVIKYNCSSNSQSTNLLIIYNMLPAYFFFFTKWKSLHKLIGLEYIRRENSSLHHAEQDQADSIWPSKQVQWALLSQQLPQFSIRKRTVRSPYMRKMYKPINGRN